MQQSDSDTQPACSRFGVSLQVVPKAGPQRLARRLSGVISKYQRRGKQQPCTTIISCYMRYNVDRWGWMIPIMRGAAGQWFLENLRSHTVRPLSRLGTIQSQFFLILPDQCSSLLCTTWSFQDVLTCSSTQGCSWTPCLGLGSLLIVWHTPRALRFLWQMSWLVLISGKHRLKNTNLRSPCKVANSNKLHLLIGPLFVPIILKDFHHYRINGWGFTYLCGGRGTPKCKG